MDNPTYTVQYLAGDDWQDYAGPEMPEYDDARKLAGEIFGGHVPPRLVRVERTVIES